VQPKLSFPDAVDLVKKCIKELEVRFMLNQKVFMVKIVDAEGVREVDLLAL
jgi:hypothetical protein